MQCDIENALLTAGAENVRFSSPRYYFSVRGNLHSWQLEVEWKDFTTLPEFFIAVEHCTQHRPHISWFRKICYSDGEGISFDYYRLEDVLVEALRKAVLVIEDGENADLSSFEDEVEGYFNSVGDDEFRGKANCYFPIDETPRKLKSFQYPNNQHSINFFENKKQCWSINDSIILNALKQQIKKGKRKLRPISALYLPLSTTPVPPLPDKQWSIKAIKEIIQPFIGEIPDIGNQLKKNKQFYIFSSPRSDGSRSAFGINIDLKHQHIRYYTTHRHSRDYLVARGCVPKTQVQPTLSIAIIGCGSVGGYIADVLSQSGHQNLTLIDFDVFHVDNCYRHILPTQYIGTSKVVALDRYLNNNYIELKITTSDDIATDWATPENIDKQSIIISATGNPTLDRLMNQRVHMQNKVGQVFISTWLEPLGLGGHVVLTPVGFKGCLNCIYTQENAFTGSPVTSFIEPGQKIARNLIGCGGAFTPFSGLDARQTALMAVRTIESYLGGHRNSLYDCWIGNRIVADSNNLVTSAVFDSNFAEKEQWWQQKIRYGCPVCRQQQSRNV